jgi:hypothetical protein
MGMRQGKDGCIEIPVLRIKDSYMDTGAFSSKKVPVILERAAIITLAEYVELLEKAEAYEQMARIQPLVDRVVVKEFQEAAYDESNLDT